MSQDAETPMTEAVADADTVTQAENSKSAVSPGEMLRHARETLNLTISDLSGQTRLSKAVLEALERNDFASLAMPVYVRGYYRKCAHVMNVPEDKLLQAYADWTGTSLTPQPLPVKVSEPPQEYDSPTRTPSWRYILVIAVILGAVLWWFGSGDEMAKPDPVGMGAPATTLDIDPPVLEESHPLPLVPPGNATPAPTDSTQTPLTPSIQQGSVLSTQPMTVPLQADESTGVANAPVAIQPPPGPTTLRLSISQASWVSVTDNDGKRLVYDLLHPGTERRVDGKPPYDVVLGHPQGVTLSVGGKRINLEPYTSNNGTARLEIKVP